MLRFFSEEIHVRLSLDSIINILEKHDLRRAEQTPKNIIYFKYLCQEEQTKLT